MMLRATNFVLCLFLSASLAYAQPAGKDPLEVYRAYLAVAAEAKTLGQLLPFYTKDLREELPKMPAEMQGNYVKMRIPKFKLAEMKVTRQTVEASRAVFDLSGRTGDGRDVTGQAILVQEGGEWKIEEDAWAIPMAPPS